MEAQIATKEISDEFFKLIDEQNYYLEQLTLPDSIHCIYNPTIYARKSFEMYIKRYCNTKKDIMYLGMNPGPWGMSQTGVPFGEIKSVRDWLGIQGPVNKPKNEIKSRPVQGFECTRTEISGKRFWGLFEEICGTPENFFRTSFVYNYLPQQWMDETGSNLTPGSPGLTISVMRPLYDICDKIFARIVELYEVKTIVAIGRFCEIRAKAALNGRCQIIYMPHPSPLNRTVQNEGWDKKAKDCLEKFNLMKYYTQN